MGMAVRKFDLNLLPVLVAIHEHGSVSAAARHLGMSQPAVSMALGKLRARYGDPLFHRAGHGMTPTPRLRALIEPLRAALVSVGGTFSAEAGFDPKTTQRTFTFAMSDLGETVFLPKILERLRKLAPKSMTRSVAASPPQIERGLENGEIDLAVQEANMPILALRKNRFSISNIADAKSPNCTPPATITRLRSGKIRRRL